MGEGDNKNRSFYSLLDKELKLRKGIDEEPIVSLVDSLLFDAIESDASDIHFEPSSGDMRVRYRLDGILYDRPLIKKESSLSVLSRLKILSQLDIAQKRIPQDGKLRVKICKDSLEDISNNENIIEMRVSTFPSIYGEKMVVRILDKSKKFIKFKNLGLSSGDIESLYKIIKRPHGFFLVTGPTGSGKTTTLYAILSELNNSKRNIITMEDPVEYSLDGITQSQINLKAGFTFEKGLRSILRQDPDVVMVGEIRDKLTAQISIEAALTGHLVLSTLHTNDSAGAVTRLVDMGIEPFLINASLSGVLAQRLVRTLCLSCKTEEKLKEQELKSLRDRNINLSHKSFFKSSGCGKCFNLGHKGRTGIFELLIIEDKIQNLVMKKSSSPEIKKLAMQNGMKALLDDGLTKVKNGQISLEELLRVIVD